MLTFQTRQIETYTAKAIERWRRDAHLLALCVGIASLMSWVERQDGHSRSHHERRAGAAGDRPLSHLAQPALPDDPGLPGLGVRGGTVRLAIPASFWASLLGNLHRPGRLAPQRWIRFPPRSTSSSFRGVPLVMVIFWDLDRRCRSCSSGDPPSFWVALSAFVHFRGGLPRRDRAGGGAAVAAGTGGGRDRRRPHEHATMRYVVLPQALKKHGSPRW